MGIFSLGASNGRPAQVARARVQQAQAKAKTAKKKRNEEDRMARVLHLEKKNRTNKAMRARHARLHREDVTAAAREDQLVRDRRDSDKRHGKPGRW